ncbi:MAG: UDP-N-acetylmuramoyl-L-alanine--D-glutamate ligase [Erysipelotrichaceae bacterium]
MNILVIGAARSGIAVSVLLAKHHHQVTLNDVGVIKDKSRLLNYPIKLIENGHPESLWEEHFDLVIKSPGIDQNHPFIQGFIQRQIKVVNEIEVALSYGKNYTIGAITGTNGKTTTTTLLGEMLKVKNSHNQACGNIGNALSEVVNEFEDETLDLALEIAAFQLIGCPSFHPLVSVIMNLTPDHLDVFKDLDEYYKAKTLVYQNQTGDDWFLQNLDDNNVMTYTNNVNCKIITFSLLKEADLCLRNNQVFLFDTFLFDQRDLKLVGRHNLQNAMLAAAMAFKMGVKQADIQDCINHFLGVEHRIEYVDTINNVQYFNDSKGTNCDATIIALLAFDLPVILLAGGYDKHTGFIDLVPYLNKVKEMIVFGATKMQLKALYPNARVVNDLKEATMLAYTLAHDQDIVLFSPACASYDQFNNYEERGKLFKEFVHNLKK